MASNAITLLASFPVDFFINWKGDVVSIRNLYRERKYRRCTVLCSELLKEAVSHGMPTNLPQNSESARYTQFIGPFYISTKPSVTKVLVTSPTIIRATKFLSSNKHEMPSYWLAKVYSYRVSPRRMATSE